VDIIPKTSFKGAECLRTFHQQGEPLREVNKKPPLSGKNTTLIKNFEKSAFPLFFTFVACMIV
jgi:hypothetical protein